MKIKGSDKVKVAMQKVAMRFRTKLSPDMKILEALRREGMRASSVSHPGGRLLQRMTGGRGNLQAEHGDAFVKALAKEIKDLPVGGRPDLAGFYPGKVTPQELDRLVRSGKMRADPLSRELALFPLEKMDRPLRQGQRFRLSGDALVLGPGGPQVPKGSTRARGLRYSPVELDLKPYEFERGKFVGRPERPFLIEGSGRPVTAYGRGDTATTRKMWGDLAGDVEKKFMTSGLGGKIRYQDLTPDDIKMMKSLEGRAQEAYATLKGAGRLPLYSAGGKQTLGTRVQDALDMIAKRSQKASGGQNLFANIEKGIDSPAVRGKIQRELNMTKRFGGTRKSALMSVWDELGLGKQSKEAVEHAIRYLNKKY